MKRFVKIFFSSSALLLALLLLMSAPLKGVAADIMFKSGVDAPQGEAGPVTIGRGDLVLLGRYLGQDICWEVLGIEDGQALLLCSNVICFKAFAADSDGVASSDWSGCELRVWLNSSERRVSGYRCEPVGENFFSGYNAYADEPGFLCPENFDPQELKLLAYDENGDRVSLPERRELGSLSSEERRRSPTAAAVKGDDSRFLQLRLFTWYWTRTATDANTSSVTAVTSSGSFYKSLSTDPLTGVCPVIRLGATELTAYGDGVNEPYRILYGEAAS